MAPCHLSRTIRNRHIKQCFPQHAHGQAEGPEHASRTLFTASHTQQVLYRGRELYLRRKNKMLAACRLTCTAVPKGFKLEL